MNTDGNTFIFSSDLSNIKNLFDWLKKNLFISISNQKHIDTLSLVINEAVVNAIIHGNKNDISKNVIFSYFIKDNKIHIFVNDEGKGISQEDQKRSEFNIKEEELLQESGRGIILIKHFSENVLFYKNTIEIIMDLR